MTLIPVIVLQLMICVCTAERPKRLQNEIKTNITNNSVTPRSPLHALFYRTEKSNLRDSLKRNFLQDHSVLENFGNTTETRLATTAVYDDNVTTAEDEELTTTVDYGNATEYSDIPEFSFFTKPAGETTTASPVKNKMSTKTKQEYCDCDLTLRLCDVNCCCDFECTNEEKNTFSHCLESRIPQENRYCYPNVFYYKNNTQSKTHLQTDNLFCILKNNLPDKRDTASYHKLVDTNEANKLIKNFYKWPETHQPRNEEKFKAKSYAYGDPLWLLSDSNINMSALYVQSPYLNNYCNERTPIRFLKNMEHKCIVKVAELAMFDIYTNVNITLLAGIPASMQEDVGHLDVKNCSTVLCIRWLIFICDYDDCELFNQKKHSPTCDDSTCVNIASKIKYLFHCLGSQISRAEMYLYVTNISTETQLLEQEIIVKYYLEKENSTIGAVVELSGSPGYILGKPVIKVHPLDDAMDVFTNNTFPLRNVISLPKNVAGACVLSNSTHKVINFGYNTKSKCRYSFVWPKQESNGTHACKCIQDELYSFLGLVDQDKTVISPLGNPSLVQTDDWINLVSDKPDAKITHGEYQHNTSLLCYNFVSAFSYEFTYANVSRPGTHFQLDRKILRAVIRYRDYDKAEFNLEEKALIVSTNVMFFDVTKPVLYEYARGPQLYIHLPSDFFYPFAWNASDRCKTLKIYFLICVILSVSMFS